MTNNEFTSNNEALESVVFTKGLGNRSYPEEGSEKIVGNEINFQSPGMHELSVFAIEAAMGDK